MICVCMCACICMCAYETQMLYLEELLWQKRLKNFCDQVQEAGHHFMLSNSDCQDGFFNDLYMQYQIERVWASRSINANPNKRGKLTELLIRNYA